MGERLFDELARALAQPVRRRGLLGRSVRAEAVGARFDELTRALAAPMPRARALRLVGSAIAVASLAGFRPRAARAEACDPGTTACGQFCCPNGFTCHPDSPSQVPGIRGLCCHPRIAPVPCRESTAPGAKGLCCPPAWTCCPNFRAASGTSHCCEPGKVCRGSSCVGTRCPPRTARCGPKCCPQGTHCCDPERGVCCTDGKTCCKTADRTTCCAKGSDCCKPIAATCCRKGTFCCGFPSLKTTPKILCCNRETEGCCAEGPPDGERSLTCCKKPDMCSKQIQPGQGGITPDSPTVCCSEKRVVPLSGTKICCPPGQVSMGGALVVPAGDAGGLCCREDKACGSGSSLTCCASGSSIPLLEQICCNGRCVSFNSDPQNCGGCGVVCPSGICRNKRCV